MASPSFAFRLHTSSTVLRAFWRRDFANLLSFMAASKALGLAEGMAQDTAVPTLRRFVCNELRFPCFFGTSPELPD